MKLGLKGLIVRGDAILFGDLQKSSWLIPTHRKGGGAPYGGVYGEVPLKGVSFFCICSLLKGRERSPPKYTFH